VAKARVLSAEPADDGDDRAKFARSIGAVQCRNLGERLRKLLQFDDRAANYIRRLLYYGFAYTATSARIAYRLSDVDAACAEAQPQPGR
jgi:hypothetical protein